MRAQSPSGAVQSFITMATLNGLYNLTDRDIVGAHLKAHAAMNTTQALHNAGLNQTVLDRTGKRIRNIDLFGSSANRKQPLRLLGKHRKHAKGIISLPRYVHVSPFKEYEQLERAPGRACVETPNDRLNNQIIKWVFTECRTRRLAESGTA